MQKRFFQSIVLILLSSCVFSQSFTTKGTDFWVSFMHNYQDTSKVFMGKPTFRNTIIYITTDNNPANVKISIPLDGWTHNFTVPPNSTYADTIPINKAMCKLSGVMEKKGINITSDNPITVYALNYESYTSDAAIVLPTPTLGNEYRVVSYNRYPGDATSLQKDDFTSNDTAKVSEFIVVGISDNTKIRITPKCPTFDGKPAGIPFLITINKGEVYQFKSDTGIFDDFTGTLIQLDTTSTDCKKFAVFSGNRCIQVPSYINYYGNTYMPCCCDHLYEQMMPVSSWGMKYITAPLKTRRKDTYRVLASQNNTFVKINNKRNIKLKAGDYYEFDTDTASLIEANSPISVAQFSRGSMAETGPYSFGEDADPFMIMLNPIEQEIDEVVFSVFKSNVISKYFVNIITKTNNIKLIKLDGKSLDTAFKVIKSYPSYSYAQVKVDTNINNHKLKSDSGFTANVYGYGHQESYGYIAGATVKDLVANFSISNKKDTSLYKRYQKAICVGDTISFIAEKNLSISKYLWQYSDQPGQTDVGIAVKHVYKKPGTFYIKFLYQKYGSCGKDSLQWPITIRTYPTVKLPEDTLVCAPYTILPSNISKKYLWETPLGKDTVSKQIIATKTGKYKLTIYNDTNNICPVSDSINIIKLDTPNINLTKNIKVCSNSLPVTIKAISNSQIFEWSTKETTSSIKLNNEGRYTVTVYADNKKHCPDTASLFLKVYQLPNKELGPPQCNNKPFDIDAGNAGKNCWYKWSTGETTQTIKVSSYGTSSYSVSVYSDTNCYQTAEVTHQLISDPIVNLGNDTTICKNHSISLDAYQYQNPNYTYLYKWNNGSTETKINISGNDPNMIINKPNMFCVDIKGCNAKSDTIFITVDPCVLIIPNIITPNGDNYNDVFKISNIDKYPKSKIVIYNRWGKKVFENENYQLSNAWTGENHPDGVYYYILYLSDGNTYNGTVTILSRD